MGERNRKGAQQTTNHVPSESTAGGWGLRGGGDIDRRTSQLMHSSSILFTSGSRYRAIFYGLQFANSNAISLYDERHTFVYYFQTIKCLVKWYTTCYTIASHCSKYRFVIFETFIPITRRYPYSVLAQYGVNSAFGLRFFLANSLNRGYF